MKRKVREFPFAVKEVTEKGEFSGYLSVFNVIDVYNEQVMPGAFATTLRKWDSLGRLPPVLWQHDWRQPVGPFTRMYEDAKGLYVEGMLLIKEIVKAAEARALMIAKAVTGMSIGFDVVIDEFNKQTGILSLKEIDLWEGSIVTFPANKEAQVDAVKSLLGGGKLPTLREFEEVLRDVGFSQKQAKIIVGHGYASLQRDVDSGKKQVDVTSIVDEAFGRTKSIIAVEELLT